ncbi:octopamine receptor beta-2R-like [Hydractinia symbiolongicarpus]|uniref:octopamine receptor beta-2R-like n=1 Tax=Hydractinia symbiolongicarpus TaxID=13093 RepID=UPI00254E57C7|nr:octopamine receptor beta-2R-like [Hydractinia symbiolongicarpus]
MSSATACNTTHGESALSFFSTTVSSVLLVTTTILNALILLVFIRNKRLLKKSIFYKMLFNIAVADFLTGIFSDPVSISFHTKEGLEKHISKAEVILVHYTLFSFNGVSILTMSLLCIDRIVALLKPLKYRNGLKNWKCYLMISSTWILANLLLIPYFEIGYIKYLTVFSYFTVAVTALSLILAAILYKIYFVPFNTSVTISKTKRDLQVYQYENVDRKGSDRNLTVPANETENALTVTKDSGGKLADPDEPKNSQRTKKKMSSSERRVNKSFITLLVVFLVTYLPSVIMTTYMNLCQNCNCMFIHALRDLTFLSILSSALWRPLNFVLRLRTIRREMKKLLGVTSLSVFSDSSKNELDEGSKSRTKSCIATQNHTMPNLK